MNAERDKLSDLITKLSKGGVNISKSIPRSKIVESMKSTPELSQYYTVNS
ncbi:hypothetical protein [Bacillus sp. 2205SS5-2]